MIVAAIVFTVLGVLAFQREDYTAAALQFFAAAFIAWQNGRNQK